jgi:hypothetical protein
MDRPHREAAVRRALAWLGAATTVLGLIGLLLVPSAYVLWVFLNRLRGRHRPTLDHYAGS